jgi:hypothetical protein
MPLPPRPGAVARAAIVAEGFDIGGCLEAPPQPRFFASASTTRLMFHCCAIESSVLVSQ